MKVTKVTVEFETDNASFADDFKLELWQVLSQAGAKILLQTDRPASLCTAPEWMDRLLDINGNIVGSVSIQREVEDGGFERTPDGHINNCALANGDLESNCQICKGTCPDRGKYPKENFMVRLKGEEKSFHCTNDCGCNVFHKDEKGRYVCNACGAVYTGEP